MRTGLITRSGFVVVAATTLALAACGGSGPTTTRSTTAASASASSQPASAAGAATAAKPPIHRAVVSRHVVRHPPPRGAIPGAASGEAGGVGSGEASVRHDLAAGSLEVANTNPCALVPAAQAQAILGGHVSAQEAPLGPTCIYQSSDHRNFVTLSVQVAALAQLKPHIRNLTKLEVDGRTGYCGVYGQATVFVPITNRRILTIAAPCDIGRNFAAKALTQHHS